MGLLRRDYELGARPKLLEMDAGIARLRRRRDGVNKDGDANHETGYEHEGEACPEYRAPYEPATQGRFAICTREPRFI